METPKCKCYICDTEDYADQMVSTWNKIICARCAKNITQEFIHKADIAKKR